MVEAAPDDAVVFKGVSLVLCITSCHFLRGTHVPCTVTLFILGVAMGSLLAQFFNYDPSSPIEIELF
jgi:uncharacterized membrane protein YgaE (UPF0421/DUF939 family)